jgi:hypothetical protein
MNKVTGRNRVRLIFALLVLAALSVLTAVGIGQALHGRAETIDSLEHWRAECEAADAAKEKPPAGFDTPAVRIRRLQTELEAVPERLFPLVVMFVLSTGLLVLGWRALRRG